MKPIHTKAKYAKVERLGNMLNFLQGQLQAAADMEKTTVQVAQKEKETAALIDLRRKVLRGKKQYMQEKANTCACLQEMLVAVKKDAELLRSRLGALKEDKSGIQEMEARLKLLETALKELAETYDGAMRQVVVCKKLCSSAMRLDEENVLSSFESLDAADHSCSCLKEMLLAVQKDTDILRSRLGALKGDAANGKEEDKSGIQEMETRFKLVERALQELGEVYDGTMRQIVVCTKLLSKEEELVASAKVLGRKDVVSSFESHFVS